MCRTPSRRRIPIEPAAQGWEIPGNPSPQHKEKER